MNDLRRTLSNLLAVAVGVLLVVAVVGVVLLSFGDHLPAADASVHLGTEPTVGPPPEAFERFHREQDDIAHGKDRGPIRCSLSSGRQVPWEVDLPDLKLSLTNTSAESVTL